MLLSRYCQTFSHKFDSDIWATAFVTLGIKREFVDEGKKYFYTYLLWHIKNLGEWKEKWSTNLLIADMS